ncbi:MAG: hypothetical protein M3R36_00985 [Bacteroidota bacterium]|nr:hypothetical protein [Bacteroidota bacterium]
MRIKIFLASSSELMDDRNEFRIFISQLNDEWSNRDIFFHLRIWEDFIDSMSREGLQNEYNKAVKECDIFLMLFFTKVGKYTAQEFEAALQFQDDNKQRIYIFFKDNFIRTGQIDDEIKSMIEFKKKLNELKHYPTIYTSIEDLKWKFTRQLEKLYINKFSADYDVNILTSKPQIDSLAIESVCKLLSPQSDDTILKSLKVPELIHKASEFGKNAVFQLAKVNRRSNRTTYRWLMERSIPVFEALIDSDNRKDRHYYFGQLGFALKDKPSPDFKNAEENFNIAIELEDVSQPEYFYKFNRAICKINNYGPGISKPSDAELKKQILSDLSYSKNGIGNQFENLVRDIDNKILLKWMAINSINFSNLK